MSNKVLFSASAKLRSQAISIKRAQSTCARIAAHASLQWTLPSIVLKLLCNYLCEHSVKTRTHTLTSHANVVCNAAHSMVMTVGAMPLSKSADAQQAYSVMRYPSHRHSSSDSSSSSHVCTEAVASHRQPKACDLEQA
eukprot:14536-Heterococcus_DN1.PRE.1